MTTFFDILNDIVTEALYKPSADFEKQKQRDFKQQLKKLEEVEKLVRTRLVAIISNSTNDAVVAVRAAPTQVAKENSLYEIDGIKELVDYITQGRQQPKTVLKPLTEYILAKYPEDPKKKGSRSTKIESALIAKATNNFTKKYQETAKAASFKDSGYVEDLMKFFPSKVSFELSPTKEVVKFVENYANQSKTIQEKCNRTAFIVENKSEILDTIFNDMDTETGDRKLCALITGLVYETGIRPGEKIGNIKIRGEKKEDPLIHVQTFGATTLQARHMTFVDPDHLVLDFIGKMATPNKAEIVATNGFQKKLLREIYVLHQKAKNISPEEFIFKNEKGVRVEYDILVKYVESNWGQLHITDFRKEKAARTLYQSLRTKAQKMYQDYQSVKIEGIQNLKEQITKKIIDTILNSVTEVQQTLSHEDWETSIEQYIDPKIIIHYLNASTLDEDYEQIIINDSRVKLIFNVDDFVQHVNQGKHL